MTRVPPDPSPNSSASAPASVLNASAFEIVTQSSAETFALGETLAGFLQDGDVVLLHGDLGAGKTTLAKGIAAALGVADVVSSPSFSLVNEYETGHTAAVTRLYHLDLYRLQGEEELASIGFDDFMAPADGLTLVEWPERAATALPGRFLLVEIETVAANRRTVRFAPVPADEPWTCRIESLRSRFAANAG